MLRDATLVPIAGTARGEVARRFYEDTLGLRFIRDDGFAFVFDVDGKEFRLSRVPAVTPSAYAVLGFQVKDIAAIADALIAGGVAMERYTFFQQDARGVWTAPDGAKVAWFRDPDMNLLSIVQHP